MSPISVEAEMLHHAAGILIDTHAHHRGQLLLIASGTVSITAEQGLWLAPPGLAVWVPPGIAHSAFYSESSSLINLQFAPLLCADLAPNCALIVVSHLLRELAHEAVRLNTLETDYATLDLVARLMAYQAQRTWQGSALFVPHGHDRRLRAAMHILQTKPDEDINFDELAALALTSSRTLARLFVAETGMSFRRWREHLRIVLAIDRLARGQSVTHTALELGYQSVSSFTTLFTRTLGHPPRKYMELLNLQRPDSPLMANPR